MQMILRFLTVLFTIRRAEVTGMADSTEKADAY